MTDKELDRLMRCVLLDSMERRETTATTGPVFTPSARHNREIRSMLADPIGWAHRRTRPVWKKVVQRVAVILLVFSLSLGSLMAVSPTVRAAVIRWVVEWYEDQIIYRYSGEMFTGKMPQYEITALPEGYVEMEEEREDDSNYVFRAYRNAELQKTIYFDYISMQQGSASAILQKDSVTILPVTVNGMSGQLFLEDDWENIRSIITWIDPERNLQFALNACLDETGMLAIAESVSLIKTEK